MRRDIEAQTGFNDQVPSGKGYLHFAPQTDNIIDAEARQQVIKNRLLAMRRAEKRHQSPILEA